MHIKFIAYLKCLVSYSSTIFPSGDSLGRTKLLLTKLLRFIGRDTAYCRFCTSLLFSLYIIIKFVS